MKARLWIGLIGAVVLAAIVLVVAQLGGREEYEDLGAPEREPQQPGLRPALQGEHALSELPSLDPHLSARDRQVTLDVRHADAIKTWG